MTQVAVVVNQYALIVKVIYCAVINELHTSMPSLKVIFWFRSCLKAQETNRDTDSDRCMDKTGD